jgi:hypothetical protein
MVRRFLATGVTLAALLVTSASASATFAAPPPGPTRFGVIASTQGSVPDRFADYVRLYDRQRLRYGAPIGIRVFGSELPLPTDNNLPGRVLAWAVASHPEEMITVSHRVPDGVRLRRLLDWVRAGTVRMSIIYRHEPQPFDPDAYRATYRAYRAVIAAHPARPRVTLEKCLGWYWQRYRVTPRTDWHAYVEAGDPADVLSWDVYAFPGMPTRQGSYGAPDDFYRYARDAWREFGLPWAVGEIGSVVQDGTGTGTERAWDRDGSRFTAWVRQMTAAASDPSLAGPSYAGMPPARFVKWWGALDSADRDLSLEQVPGAAAAYRQLVRAHHL